MYRLENLFKLERPMQCKNNKRLLANGEICLITQPEIAITIGRSEAIFLQQLHYWLTTDNDIGHVFDGQKWIYNSYKSWAKNIRIFSESTIRRAVSKLERMGIILTKNMNKKKSDHTKWYTINYTGLKELIPTLSNEKPLGQNARLLKMNSPYVQNEQIINKETEITSETKPLSTEGRGGSDKSFKIQQVHIVEEESLLIDKNSGNKGNLALELLEIWNQTVRREQGQGESLLQLTKKRAQYLVAAFKYHFESNQLKWKHFCQQIASSDFLMGKVKPTFKASLDWVLKFDVIQRILEGDFGVKEHSFADERNSQLDAETLHRHIEARFDDSETIKQLRKSILTTFGEQTYQSWFAELTITQKGRGGDLELKASSSFIRDYIQTNYLNKLEALTGQVMHIFCV